MARSAWRGVINIRLNSDLCVASGDGYSSSIDIDVCHDGFGVPIIPARRLKGCLREAACLLGYENSKAFDALFGIGGSSEGGSLRIADAKLLGADDIIKMQLDGDASHNPQNVLSLFTYTRAQTALDGCGIAKDNTLRFIRVVKQYVPISLASRVDEGPAPLEFDSAVSCANDEAQIELLTVCCKALRNIGHGRNRGFGAVTCKLEHGKESKNSFDENNIDKLEGATRISYAVRLDSALMLPQQNGTETLGFIPGASVLGYFAGRLSGSPQFDDLFLRGKVRFSPLYPVHEGVRCCPAPPFVVKIKGGRRDGKTCTAWQAMEGETTKPLKDGFIGIDLQSKQAATEIVYHHSVNTKNANGTLYTQRCLQPGQLFAGYIEGNGSLLRELALVLASDGQGDISFGRSKTAQYSFCSLVGMSESNGNGSLDIKQGERYAFLLDSDVLLTNEGLASSSFADLKEAIKDALGPNADVFDCADVEEDACQLGTSLRYRIVTGYNAKWNQKKPHIQVFGAGSSIVFESAASITSVPAEFFIGERLQEGFGRVLLVAIDEDGNPLLPFDSAPTWSAAENAEAKTNSPTVNSIEKLRCAAIGYAEANKQVFGSDTLGRAFIGRLMRMVEESFDKASFEARVASIKSEQKRKTAVRLASGLARALGTDIGWPQEKECLIVLLTMGKYYAKQAERAVGVQHEEGQRHG